MAKNRKKKVRKIKTWRSKKACHGKGGGVGRK